MIGGKIQVWKNKENGNVFIRAGDADYAGENENKERKQCKFQV